ncbi:MAG: MFS transporter [Proteobacteria bacterium]|nr:MFS transporter [Pseudomonadota bacterium]
MTSKSRAAIFAAAALGYMLSQFFRSFLTVIYDDLVRDLGIGPAEFGALGSAWFFAFSLSQFPVGIALDRVGPRLTIAFSLLFAVAGAWLFSAATTPFTALVGMALIGIGCAPQLMGPLYFFAKTEPPQRFAAIGSVFLACGLIGGLVAASPLALLVKAIGWRASMQVFAVISLIVAALIYAVFRDPPKEKAPEGGSLFGDVATLLKAPGMVPILVMAFAISAPVFTERSLWIGPYFGEVHGLDLIGRGNAVLLLALAMTASAIFSGPIASLINDPKRVVLVANLLCAAMFLLLGFWPAPPLPIALALMALAGLFGVSYAVLIAHGRLFMPPHVLGRGITFINFVSIGGTGVAQLLSGHAVEAMRAKGMSPAATYDNLHIAFGLLLLVSALIYARAPARPKTP